MKSTLVPCRKKNCKHEPFQSERAEQTHYHRVHSGRIMVPGQTSPKPVVARFQVNGGKVSQIKMGKRTKAWRQAHPELAKRIGFAPGSGPVISRNPRSKLTAEQMEGIINFIRTRRQQFSTKAACFTAALEASNAVGVITNNSTAVNRYFEKASVGTPKRRNGKLGTVVLDQSVHFCPNCLTSLLSVARYFVKTGQASMKVNGCPVCGCNVKEMAKEMIIDRHINQV